MLNDAYMMMIIDELNKDLWMHLISDYLIMQEPHDRLVLFYMEGKFLDLSDHDFIHFLPNMCLLFQWNGVLTSKIDFESVTRIALIIPYLFMNIIGWSCPSWNLFHIVLKLWRLKITILCLWIFSLFLVHLLGEGLKKVGTFPQFDDLPPRKSGEFIIDFSPKIIVL